MLQSPELQLLIINAVIATIAYGGIYPSLRRKTLNTVMAADTVVSVVALATAGALYWGSGVEFSLILFDVNWFVFSLFTLMAMEIPLFLYFARKHNIEIFDAPDDDP